MRFVDPVDDGSVTVFVVPSSKPQERHRPSGRGSIVELPQQGMGLPGLPAEIARRCWFLAGATACGKSAVAMALAELGPTSSRVEILALDSMTLYRGMDIGTAKPTVADRARVPHHLVDELDPSESYNVAEYVRRATELATAIVSRGGTPLFVGGSGLFLRSLLRGLAASPPADAALRQTLEAEAQRVGLEGLHQQLAKLDPTTAARLPVSDVRRVIRALEVTRLTGRPFSSWHAEGPLPVERRPPHVYWLAPPRPWLHARINQRVESMLAAGWLDEARQLRLRPQGIGLTARQALGYQELWDWLEAIEAQRPGDAGGSSKFVRSSTAPERREVIERPLDWSAVVETIQTRTRQFAKRQETWFRNLVECQAIPMVGTESPEAIARMLRTRCLDRR